MRWVSWGWGVAVLVGGLLVIQGFPYGKHHENSAVAAEPSWDSQQTREFTVRPCFECHSNENVWLWYSILAPLLWLMQRDLDEGRAELNFSEWNRPQEGRGGG